MKITRKEMDELGASAIRHVMTLRPDIGQDNARKIMCRAYYSLRAAKKGEKQCENKTELKPLRTT